MDKSFVYSFLNQVEETMRYILLVEITGSTILLCLTMYYVIMVITINNFREAFTGFIMHYSLIAQGLYSVIFNDNNDIVISLHNYI